MNPASNLILVGPMGAGKSTIGRRLAKRFGLRFVDLDRVIETETGARIPLIFEIEGEPGFRDREHQSLQQTCTDRGMVLATGGGAVLRADNRSLLRDSGFVVWLRTDVAHQLERLRNDTTRPLLAAPDREQRLTDMATLRNPLYREVADLVFVSDQSHVGAAAERLARVLERRWQRPAAAPEPTVENVLDEPAAQP
ncbi:shikimate kinase [Aquimonas sp.]|jgi:shikimate kinase|uniref:shikimate kinase n=1 Tax=Aquimonas sp. TaxID=1872588 RepID=UPI0037BE7600